MRLLTVLLFCVACSAGDTASRQTGAAGGEPIAGANDPGTVTRRSAVGSSTRPVIAPTPPQASPEGVGYVPGSGAVQLDGSFRYSIPIDVPPGRGGMEPGLSLEYSSRGGNGPLGVGWSLGGTSAIRRCDKIVASGGVRAGIVFAPNDAYCLDGQRLVNVAGTAGQVGAEYRTEVETFTRVKITAVGGSWGGGEDGTAPSAWTVEFKDGRVASYQSIPWDVAQDAAGIPYGLRTLVDTSGAVTRTEKRNDLVWPLVKVTDRSGNSIVWEDMGTDVNGPGYVRSTTALGVGSEPLPSRILYTKCDLQPCIYASETRRVEFGYKDRSASDPIRSFVRGMEVVTTRQLETITTSVKDGSTWVKQREYRLGYAPSATSRRTLLRSVTVCDGAGICATPTTFSWQDTASGGYLTHTSSPAFAYTTALNSGIGTMEIAAFDANGDGNDDVTLLEFTPDNTIWKKRVILADGGGYYQSAVDVAWPETKCRFGHPGASIPVDLDANGRTELVYECSEEGYRVLGWDDAAGTLVEQDVPGVNGRTMPAWPVPGGVVAPAAEGMLKFADLDGDGLPDMIWGATNPADATWTAQKGIPTSLTPATLPQISYGTPHNTHIRSIGPPGTLTSAERLIGQVTTVLDQNGDGHAELTQMDYRSFMRAYSHHPVDRATYTYRDDLGNGSFWISQGLTNTLNTNWGEPIYDSGNKRGLWYFADVNGDGLKDALYREEVGSSSAPAWFLRMNTGDGYTSPTTNLGPAAVALTDYATDLIKHPDAGVIGKGSDNGLRIADMNGDGRDDLVLLEPAGTPGSHWSLHAKTTGQIRILHSNGRGWDAPVNLPAYPPGYVRLFYGKGNPNPRWPMSTLADVDGNGLPDVVEMVGDTTTKLRTLVTQALGGLPGGVDLLNGVQGTGRGNQQIYYAAMSSGSGNRGSPGAGGDVHVPARSATYPQAIATKGHVVRQFSTRVGEAGEINETYQYEGGLVDVTGRGLLGFDKVTKTDRVTGVKTTYRFDLRPVIAAVISPLYRHYPRAGRPMSTETTAPATGFGQHAPDLQDATGAVATPRSTWEVDFTGHPLRVLNQRTTSFVEASSSSSNVATVIKYDEWQNPFSVKTTTTDATVNPPRVYTREVFTGFSNTASTWLLGQATSVKETTDSSGVDPYQEDPASPSGSTFNTRSTSFEYDALGRLAWVYREPSSGLSIHRVQRIYRSNGGGVVTRVKDYAPTGVSCGSNTDCPSNACLATKSNGAKQCYNDAANDLTYYDASGSVAEGFRNGLGQTQWVLYDPAHMWPYATMDLNGVKTEIKRDGFGRVRETRSDTGAKTTYSYEQNIVRETELNGRSRTTFRTAGRPVLTTWSTFNGGTGIAKVIYNSLGKSVRTLYNTSTLTQGEVSKSRSDAEAALEGGLTIGRADYDAAGRPTSTINGTTEKTSYTYLSPLGTTRVTDASGLETTTAVDLLGRPLRVDQKSAAGQTYNTNYRYRGDGSLTSIRNPDGIVDRFYYDSLGRRTSWRTGGFSGTLANSVVRWAATYDSLDKPVTVERDGVVSTYTYDALGRETSRTSGTEHQVYGWDATNGVGQRKSISTDTGGGHETLFTYNTLGQLEERRENYAGGKTSLSYGYTYDAVGRLDKMRYPEVSTLDVSAASHTHRGLTVRYTYQNGQLKQISEVLAGSEPVLWEATRRHVMGMLEAAKYGSAITNVWGYDPNTLRPSTQATTGNSGPTINQSFVYFENGTLKQKTASDIVENFEYDGSRRFLRTYSRRSTGNDNFTVDATFSHGVQGVTGVDTTAATATDWSSDDETYTFHTAVPYKYRLDTHKIGTASARSFVYDSAGRVRDIWEGMTIKRHYDWNTFNLPTTVNHFDTNVTRTFGYDGVGARVRKTQNAINEVLYVGDLYEARNLTELGTWESVYRLRTDVGIVAELVHPWGQTTRTTRYLFTDQQGSPAFEVTGTTPTKRGFFPYGKRMGTPPAQNFSQIGYTGHRQDDDLGLIDMKGRVYDIRTRRFLTRDPLPDQIFTSYGTHPYSYVGNNPTNLVDPNGFQSGTSYPGNVNQSAQTLAHVAASIAEAEKKVKPPIVHIPPVIIIGELFPGPKPGDPPPDAGEPGDAAPGDSGEPGDAGEPVVDVRDGEQRDGGRLLPAHRNNAGDAGRSEVFSPPAAPPPIMPPMVGQARGLADPMGYGPVETFVGDSPGLTGYTAPARRYAQVDVADVLSWAGDMWAAEHPDAPRLQFGDISKEGGGPLSGHSSHQKGVDVDIRVMSTAGEIYDKGPDKNGEGATQTYSQELTRDAIQTVLNAASDFGVDVTYVFFDDAAMRTDLIRPDKDSDHDDHFHVRFHIP